MAHRICRVCGEDKPPEQFFNIPNFTKYKKHAVLWCRDCQRLWMDMRKDKERQQKLLTAEQRFTVSFE